MSTTDTSNLSEVSDLLDQFNGRAAPVDSVEHGDSGDAVQAAPSTETTAAPEPVAVTPEVEPEPEEEVEDPYAALDQSLVSAARKAKWTDDKIKALVQRDPETAKDVLTAIRDAQRDKDRLAGELGSLKQQQKAAEADASLSKDTPPKPAAKTDDRREQAKKILLEALGDGEQSDALLKAIQIVTEPVSEEVSSLKQAKQTETLEQMRSQFAATAEQFFTKAEGAESIYGKGSTTDVPEEFFERRRQVAEVADQLVRGSNFSLPFDKAFEMAHGAVSLPLIKQLNTKSIADKAAKRAAQASIPPSQARNGLSSSPSIQINGHAGQKVEVSASDYADAQKLLEQYRGVR